MKYATAAAAAAIALIGAAVAQTTTTPAAPVAPATPSAEFAACPPLPVDPGAWPPGATTKAKDMDAAQKRYNDWEAAIAPAVTCRRAAQQKAKAIAEATTEAFNADATRINTVRAAWKTEADAFMARQATAKQDKGTRTGR
jgi:hypothetical protein